MYAYKKAKKNVRVHLYGCGGVVAYGQLTATGKLDLGCFAHWSWLPMSMGREGRANIYCAVNMF
jgi:hypothetical protein